ncbi:hypothetical protein K439DRAFT_1649053 [Ramaria rubella]|nr:hypothetical protein K439DRAFT_1649053 [Ramaria rubella]
MGPLSSPVTTPVVGSVTAAATLLTSGVVATLLTSGVVAPLPLLGQYHCPNDGAVLLSTVTAPVGAVTTVATQPHRKYRLPKRTVPLVSLANGNWIGQVPLQLRGLMRKNYCVIRMCANAALPPHRNELDEVLEFIFTGPTKPTEKELCRTPLLALKWLKCNHKDYFDLDISIHNLNPCKDNEIPSTSIHDIEAEEGTTEGAELPIHNSKKLIAIAIEHLQNEGRVLGCGSSQPASFYVQTILNFILKHFLGCFHMVLVVSLISFALNISCFIMIRGFRLIQTFFWLHSIIDKSKIVLQGWTVCSPLKMKKLVINLLVSLIIKFMRNECWSLLAYLGAPTWYITFAFADVKHPISLIRPVLNVNDSNHKLIADNPVATFLKHVICINDKEAGLYRRSSGHYGTVEQGCLTLHLHMLLWIKNNSGFQKTLVEYLESSHVGEFLNGTVEDVRSRIDHAKDVKGYVDPTMSLPDMPPLPCPVGNCKKCQCCKTDDIWWERFYHDVDDLFKVFPTCLKNKWQTCKANPPRDLYQHSEVDPKTGYINLKKGEAWMNTFIVTYLLRCNSDVTSLLSGTAIKAVIAYVTDYISKSPLKTYGIFESIRDVFDRNAEMLSGEKPRHEKACKLLTSIVNSMITKMEIGAPMASAYLLEQPDHYTSHKFKPFYWMPFVRQVRSAWPIKIDSNKPESVLPIQNNQVVLGIVKGSYAAFSVVSDSTLRPDFYDDITTSGFRRRARFLRGHPQRDSHRIVFLPDNKALVPNFVGGAIPRSDKGDHEYYCATMLTLFKPWRTGFDLKKHSQTWTEAFTSHTFTDRQLQIMRLFQIRYECNDAIDDHHAQRLKDTTDVQLGDVLDKGYKTLTKEHGMQTAEQIAMTSGWLDDCLDNLPPSEDCMPIDGKEKAPPEWSDMLETEKERCLGACLGHMGSQAIAEDNIPAPFDPTGFTPNDVKILDASYLVNDFKAKQVVHKQQVDNTVNMYGLKPDKEHAFRILANQCAIQPSGEQLKMYLGGMAGTGKSQVIKVLAHFFEECHELHRFQLVAPTGAASALIGGTTYHSLLGIYPKRSNEVKVRLNGTDYILLDEIYIQLASNYVMH